MKKLIPFLLVLGCDGEVRPYVHHRLDLLKDQCMRQLENPDPKNDVCGPLITVCQTVEGFKAKETERINLKERLKACEEASGQPLK